MNKYIYNWQGYNLIKESLINPLDPEETNLLLNFAEEYSKKRDISVSTEKRFNSVINRFNSSSSKLKTIIPIGLIESVNKLLLEKYDQSLCKNWGDHFSLCFGWTPYHNRSQTKFTVTHHKVPHQNAGEGALPACVIMSISRSSDKLVIGKSETSWGRPTVRKSSGNLVIPFKDIISNIDFNQEDLFQKEYVRKIADYIIELQQNLFNQWIEKLSTLGRYSISFELIKDYMNDRYAKIKDLVPGTANKEEATFKIVSKFLPLEYALSLFKNKTLSRESGQILSALRKEWPELYKALKGERESSDQWKDDLKGDLSDIGF